MAVVHFAPPTLQRQTIPPSHCDGGNHTTKFGLLYHDLSGCLNEDIADVEIVATLNQIHIRPKSVAIPLYVGVAYI